MGPASPVPGLSRCGQRRVSSSLQSCLTYVFLASLFTLHLLPFNIPLFPSPLTYLFSLPGIPLLPYLFSPFPLPLNLNHSSFWYNFLLSFLHHCLSLISFCSSMHPNLTCHLSLHLSTYLPYLSPISRVFGIISFSHFTVTAHIIWFFHASQIFLYLLLSD